MIISHKYRFIFLKTRRTGGSSFEKAVAPFLGENDIITGSLNDGTERKNLDDNPKITGHCSWLTIEELAGSEAFESYFKFCFERNSYEKAISEWFYKKGRNQTQLDLIEYTNQHPVSDIKRYYSPFSDGQSKFMIFQYETFSYVSMIRSLLSYLGIPPDAINGIHLKKTWSKNYFGSDINEFINVVQKNFTAEIKMFNYHLIPELVTMMKYFESYRFLLSDKDEVKV